MDRKIMRILVLGDQNVGKTSLIHTIYCEVSENVTKTLKKVILPPEMCLYSKEVFTELVDTSFDMDEKTLKSEIQISDLILLVYDATEQKSIERLQSQWLPKICLIKAQIPIILVGNKKDKTETEQYESWQLESVKQILKRVTKNFRNVQMGVQCSAYFNRNVPSVLNCAQRAILYPLAPLYNLQKKKITQQFRKALIRIFRILDHDMDGKLRDQQLNQLQERVFQSELSKEDVNVIKQKILREFQVQQNYIQLQGFITLQKQCIEMLKIQICWSILRHFHYDDKLRIKLNNNYMILDQEAKEAVELSSDTINFLMNIYNMSTKKNKLQNSGIGSQLYENILKNVFEPCPQIQLPQFNKMSQMNQQRFLTTWDLYAFINYQKCYQTLLYLGYQKNLQETFNRKKKKKFYKDFSKIKDNKVYSILVVDSNQYKAYLSLLFIQSQKIQIKFTSKCQGFSYQRASYLYANQNISKTFLLFLVKQEDLQNFFTNKQTAFAQKMDVLVQFQEENTISQLLQKNKGIPNTILHKMISKLNPQLRLQQFPIKVDSSAFFEQIIKVIQKIELGLLKKKLQEFKQEQKRQRREEMVIASGVIVGSLVSSYLLFKYFNQQKQR